MSSCLQFTQIDSAFLFSNAFVRLEKMAENSAEKEDLLIQIRDKLRRDGIKLWLEPYLSLQDLHKFSQIVSQQLNIPQTQCQEILLELQQNCLENLKQKNQFEQSGLATLKVRILVQGQARVVLKEVMLSCRGQDLKEMISDDVKVSPERLKLITSGRVIANETSLSTQQIKNGQQILAIILPENPHQIEEEENKIKDIETTKTDSSLLATDGHYMRLEDQDGNPIKIPKQEKTAVIVAMTLHEKGRSAIKREDYTTALVYLLEADQEFKRCSSVLLNSVDNYALLDLDIAWCYLCLQSISHLPEASERLRRCDGKLQETYGPNMERVIALKGGCGNEACLMARLHLLQAVILYHQNKRPESLEMLRSVEQEIGRLKVDDCSVHALLELGFSEAEARLGLRECNGDVNRAATYIEEHRQKRWEVKKKALAQKVLDRERRKLGLCLDGRQYVDPNFLKILVNMGYNKEQARKALKCCNNIISDAVQYIEEHAGPSRSRSTEFRSLIEDLVPQLVEAGFDSRMANIALVKHGGDLFRATEELLSNDGVVEGDLSQYDFKSDSIEKIRTQRKEEREKKREAFDRLREDLSVEKEDGELDIDMDFNLQQEEVFLRQYISLLEK